MNHDCSLYEAMKCMLSVIYDLSCLDANEFQIATRKVLDARVYDDVL